ncbi:MAG: hypothetical protein VCC67_15410, partial [Myxococcota bacterium]
MGGTVNKLVIDFEGGGACWNEFTCSVAGAIFNEAVYSGDIVQAALDSGFLGGIYDRTHDANPFKDWY